MALSPAALAGIYHALMGMPANAESASALPLTSTMESLQQQVMLQQMAAQHGVVLPTPADLQQAAMTMSYAGGLQAQIQRQVVNAVAEATGIPSGYELLGVFEGHIQAYDDKKGFGFVTCDDLKNLGYKKDPFLLRTQLNGCKLGDIVKFKAVLNEKSQLLCWGPEHIRDGVPETWEEKGARERKRKAAQAALDQTFADTLKQSMDDPLAANLDGDAQLEAEIQAQLLLQTQALELNSAPDRPGPKKPGLVDASWMSKLSTQQTPTVPGAKKAKWAGYENATEEEKEQWKSSGYTVCDEWVDPATASEEEKKKWEEETGWTADWKKNSGWVEMTK